MVIEDSSPVRPLDQAVGGRVVHDLAPPIAGSTRGRRGPQTAVDAVVATGEEDDARQLVLEGEIVDDEAIELETPSKTVSFTFI
jgi:hypothetical protein